MRKEKVLITVKTYPTLSKSHVELVCTAGLREDGSWIRLYPIPFRLMDEDIRFPKWHWMELPVVRRMKDHRQESYSPADLDAINLADKIGTEDKWRERRRFVLGKSRVWTNMSALIEAAKQEKVSLATFKPSRMLGLDIQEEEQREWSPEALENARQSLRQGDLFREQEDTREFVPAEKIPYGFWYRFEDEEGRESRLKIIDWEIGMLYRNCVRDARGNEEVACAKVREMYEAKFFQTDLHFFLGTTHAWHDRALNPWMIVGVVPFPVELQGELCLTIGLVTDTRREVSRNQAP